MRCLGYWEIRFCLISKHIRLFFIFRVNCSYVGSYHIFGQSLKRKFSDYCNDLIATNEVSCSFCFLVTFFFISQFTLGYVNTWYSYFVLDYLFVLIFSTICRLRKINQLVWVRMLSPDLGWSISWMSWRRWHLIEEPLFRNLALAVYYGLLVQVFLQISADGLLIVLIQYVPSSQSVGRVLLYPRRLSM